MMKGWQLSSPMQAIIFDCDGTLTSIEGIDELAKLNDMGDIVQALTAQAMGGTGMNTEIYEARLKLVSPTQNQVVALAAEYFRRAAPDIFAIIKLYIRFNKNVYVISAGLYPAIAIFCELLGIPSANVFAVNIQFDENGNYRAFDKTSPLVQCDGKRDIVSKLMQQHKEILYVGDGLNDYATHDLVTRFVGYGGAYYRQNIYDLCDYYISTESMAPLLPLSLTQAEIKALSTEELDLYQRGIKYLHSGKVKVKGMSGSKD